MYTTSLCSHGSTIYAKLVQMEKQIQTHCLYPHSQINTPEYDSNIDGQIDTPPDSQSHAKNNQKESTPTTGDSEDPKFPQDTNRTDPPA